MGSTDWLSIGGWAFEIFTAVLSIVDVLSDVLVAQQFYSDGHMGWFWMVMASLFVSNAIYAGFAIVMIMQDRYHLFNGDSPRGVLKIALAYVLCFPLAQFFPLAQWYLEIYDNHLQPWLYPSKVKNDVHALP
jgi:Ni/Fe-hydrogenase subunit HybB-like protein